MILHQKSFYMIRHGESTDNAAGMISGGGRDPDLTDQGRKQAMNASAHFLKLSPQPTKIVVSALRRTHQTAALVTGNMPHIMDERLNERYLGELDGTITEAQQKSMGALPGEETSKDHFARVMEAINHHIADDDVTLFVAHGGTLRRVLEAVNITPSPIITNATFYHFFHDKNEWQARPL